MGPKMVQVLWFGYAQLDLRHWDFKVIIRAFYICCMHASYNMCLFQSPPWVACWQVNIYVNLSNLASATRRTSRSLQHKRENYDHRHTSTPHSFFCWMINLRSQLRLQPKVVVRKRRPSRGNGEHEPGG